jgi:hypothetical protein
LTPAREPRVIVILFNLVKVGDESPRGEQVPIPWEGCDHERDADENRGQPPCVRSPRKEAQEGHDEATNEYPQVDLSHLQRPPGLWSFSVIAIVTGTTISSPNLLIAHQPTRLRKNDGLQEEATRVAEGGISSGRIGG